MRLVPRVRLTDIRQARDKEKLSRCRLSLNRINLADRLFRDFPVDMRACESRIQRALHHFHLDSVHAQAHGFNFETDPFFGRRALGLVEAVRRFHESANLVRRPDHFFSGKGRRCVLAARRPIFPVFAGAQMVDLGGRVVVADELLIPAHDGNVLVFGLLVVVVGVRARF
jgi:hypothetical protein